MNETTAEHVTSHPHRDLVIFVLVAFALTWAVWVPRAAGVDVGLLGPLSTWMPAIAALVCAALLNGRAGVADLGRRLVRWRVGWIWYPVVLLGPGIFSLLVAGIAWLLGLPWDEARPQVLTLPVYMWLLTLLVLIVTDGLGEELAWRGYALPRLLDRHGPIVASLLLGVVWAAWHLPLVWTSGAVLEGKPIWLLLVDLLVNSLIFTWVFLRTRGSVLIAVLLHAASNLFTASPNVGPDGDLTVPLVALVAKSLLAVALYARRRA